jgi:hypothetical protein
MQKKLNTIGMSTESTDLIFKAFKKTIHFVTLHVPKTRQKQSGIIRTSNWSFLKTASMSIRSFFDPVLSGR